MGGHKFRLECKFHSLAYREAHDHSRLKKKMKFGIVRRKKITYTR